MTSPQNWQRIADLETRLAVQEVAQALPTVQPVAAFRAYRSAALTLPNPAVSNTHITFDLVEYDLASEYTASTGFWAPKYNGIYQVSAGVGINTLQGDGAQLDLKIYKNGSRERYFALTAIGANIAPQLNGADAFLVKVGDVFDVRVTVAVNSTAIFTGVSGTWFSATLLRQIPQTP